MPNQYSRYILSSIMPIMMCALYISSSIPNLTLIEVGIDWFDKLVHIVAFFFLGLGVTVFIILNLPRFSFKKQLIFILIIGVLYGVFDEIHQSFVPGRFADIGDLIADTIGITISLLFIKLLKKNLQKYAR